METLSPNAVSPLKKYVCQGLRLLGCHIKHLEFKAYVQTYGFPNSGCMVKLPRC